MGDIANKEQAEKCRDLGKDFMRQGDHEKAARFFAKSLRMYALPGVSELRDKAEELHRRGSAAPSSGGSTPKTSSGASGGGSSRPAQPQQSRPAPASPAASASASAGTATGAGDRPYTPEQESGAARIVTLSKKCYYQTLSISKRADEVEIKKAYRKLALKFHPDKNSAPSAEAAFKALNAAMETLSDPNKRQVYDDMGHEGAQQVNNGGGGGGGGFGGRHPNDLSPEDLMNMFFGGGMGGSFGGGGFRTYNFGGGPRMRRATRQHQQQQQQHRAEEPDNGGGGGLGQLFQLIPMLLLLLSMTGFFSGGAAGNNPWSKPFALHKEHPYNIQRFTASYGITKDIPYFVTDSFRTTYAASKGDLRRAEAQVEQDFKTDLYNRCDREKKHKARQIYEAKRVRNQEAQQEALKKADGLETKSCDDFFNKWKFSRY